MTTCNGAPGAVSHAPAGGAQPTAEPAMHGSVFDPELQKTVLALNASGDMFVGPGPNGVKKDGSLRAPDEAFRGWAWREYEPVGLDCAPYCHVRRVGALLTSVASFSKWCWARARAAWLARDARSRAASGVVEVRMKPCAQFGAASAIWLFAYEEQYCDPQQAPCSPDYTRWCCTTDPCTRASDMCRGQWLNNQEIDIELPTAPSAAKADTADPAYITFRGVRYSTYTAVPADDGQCSAVRRAAGRRCAPLRNAHFALPPLLDSTRLVITRTLCPWTGPRATAGSTRIALCGTAHRTPCASSLTES